MIPKSTNMLHGIITSMSIAFVIFQRFVTHSKTSESASILHLLLLRFFIVIYNSILASRQQTRSLAFDLIGASMAQHEHKGDLRELHLNKATIKCE